MAMLKRLQDFLDRSGAGYTHHVHPLAFTAKEVASAEKVAAHKVAKCIVFFSDTGYGMAVLPADSWVNLQELREALGVANIRLATEKELDELFPECELGAMPPLGALFGLPLYVDGSMAEEEEIAFNAGTHRDVVYMKYRDFERLNKPVTLQFARYLTA